MERKVRPQKNSGEIHAGMLGYVDTSEREDEIYEEDKEKGKNVQAQEKKKEKKKRETSEVLI